MGSTNGGPPPAEANQAPPQLNVLAQYVKDLSFENPNAPGSLQQQQQAPKINIQINVNAKPLAETEFEVELKIEGRAELPAVVQNTAIPNLFVITSGQTALGPSALFDSDGVAVALTKLREAFDFVLFDLAPVNVYSDASILAPRLDAALIVIEADRTRIPDVERTRRTLERVVVRLVGSVLNRRRDYIPAFIEELL